ncbi:hypothetical protein Ahy_B08g093412 [Arachis hypogaea]|uniref:Aminotransferase-like plant mobile domain-containing protein n=1 Tax=Arachis hypogaea TaxID=3818 RepID=A0A444Y615_ARAHY|nr:hypothetical protein Ahy_B08g093412 [Arachis hypogaea]
MIDDGKLKLRMLTCNHPVPLDRYNDKICYNTRLSLITRYVRCHIMLLIGTILFGDKSGAGVHWKFLPLLRDFVNIGQFSWGSACLAHLYRALCRASRYNCKEIDGPLTLLLDWAWIRLPYISPFPREPRNSVELIEDILNWERGDQRYRFLKLAHFRKAFDELQEGQFAWVAYAVDRVDPNIIPAEIYMQSVVWSATVPLMSFECIEWHATDRVRRQFGFVQGSLDKAHGEVLTGPKNLNWAMTPTHSIWVMHWTNRIHDIFLALSEPIFSQITPLSSSNEIIKGITTSTGFSQINFTPSTVSNKI